MKGGRSYIILILTLLSIRSSADDISFLAGNHYMEESITLQTLEDAMKLLHQACSCEVTLNDVNADILIILPEYVPKFEMHAHYEDSSRNYPFFFYPEHGYTWNIRSDEASVMLELDADSYAGVSNGIYGLLQEKLGFAFYHPRESIVPDLTTWPIRENSTWTAVPRFEKKGFHLHTMHPIELTEQLMMLDDESWPDVKEYIDWLARNQQNYFEYNLLEGIDRSTWPSLAKRMVDYLHSRGIIAGLDLSLHMTQQKAYMLYQSPPNSLLSRKKQIKRHVELLFEADWDVWNVEFSSTEFTTGNVQKKKELQAFLNAELIGKDAKLMGREHVVKKEGMIGGAGSDEVFHTSELDEKRGVMSHTVMFYTASEERAPVYGNENLRHMLHFHKREQQVRETWYYPESAYWITFDNSVPMFLLPYLQARLDDILTMQALETQGHLTFSSGWEWGYWLIDWSIARWSWEFSNNGKAVQPSPLQYLEDLPVSESVSAFVKGCLVLQQAYLKDKGLISYLTAQTVTDEIGGALNLQLHPRPDWKYGWLMNNAPSAKVNEVVEEVLPLLNSFVKEYDSLKEKYGVADIVLDETIEAELVDALDVVALRAQHRFYTLDAITRYRGSAFNSAIPKNHFISLDNAKDIRLEALELVRRQEMRYRYPVESLASRHWNHTYCHFGYLYPVHDLHFWKREELQIRRNRWGPLFMNIWNIPRTIGLTD